MDDPYNKPIAVTDASSMFRADIKENEPPYTVKVIKLNNKLVDDWEKTVLRKLADKKGNLPAGKVSQSWGLYIEGKNIWEYAGIKHMIPRPTKEQLDFWIKTFEESSIEDLFSLGVGTLGFGWNIIENEIRFWNADKKWEKIFSKSKDPLDWVKSAPAYRNLLLGEDFPFWDKRKWEKIRERVGTILSLQITSASFRQKITYNMRPLTKIVAKLNNDLISRWEKETLGIITERTSLEPKEFAEWELWYEKQGLESYKKVRDMLVLPNQSQIDFWKMLLETSTIEELHAKGSGVVLHAHKVIQDTIRSYLAEQKLKGEHQEGDLPFWDKETLQDISMKIGTILSVQISPIH